MNYELNFLYYIYNFTINLIKNINFYKNSYINLDP